MQTKNKVLFDTSTFLALIKKEPGYQQLEILLASSAISSVNLAEVINALTKLSIPMIEVEEILDELVPEVIPFTHKISILTGSLGSTFIGLELSLSDKASIATAIAYNMTLYTTNQQLQSLNLDKPTIIVVG